MAELVKAALAQGDLDAALAQVADEVCAEPPKDVKDSVRAAMRTTRADGGEPGAFAPARYPESADHPFHELRCLHLRTGHG
jgi:hypothetical protein